MEDLNKLYYSYPHLDQLVISPNKLQVEQKVAVVWQDGCCYRGLVKWFMSVKQQAVWNCSSGDAVEQGRVHQVQ